MELFHNKKHREAPELSPAGDLTPEIAPQGLHAAGNLPTPEEKAEQSAPAANTPFVLRIEGMEPAEAEQQPLPTLKGGTGTLPDPETVKEELPLVADIEQSPAEPVKQAPVKSEPVREEQPPADLEQTVAETVRRAQKAAQTLKQPEKPAAAPKAAAPEPPVKRFPDAPKNQPELANVSYASMAKAVEQAQKEPTGRFARDAVDDETLLAELYTLIGDGNQPRPVTPAPRTAEPVPAPRPMARITDETLKTLPEEDEVHIEEDSTGAPGWLKGLFILLISLLLSAMTFYAVASDLLGEIF